LRIILFVGCLFTSSSLVSEELKSSLHLPAPLPFLSNCITRFLNMLLPCPQLYHALLELSCPLSPNGQLLLRAFFPRPLRCSQLCRTLISLVALFQVLFGHLISPASIVPVVYRTLFPSHSITLSVLSDCFHTLAEHLLTILQ
jgi:hypothetical protein